MVTLLVRLRTNLGRKKLKEIKQMLFQHYDPVQASFTTLSFAENIVSEGLKIPKLISSDSSTFRFKTKLIATHFGGDEIYPVLDDEGNTRGSMWNLGMLLKRHIEVIMEMAHLRNRVQWFLDEHGEKRENFWVIAVGADGFPRNKQCTKSTEMCVQLLNLGGLSNSAKWTLLLFGLDEGESSVCTTRCLKVVSEEMSRIEMTGISIGGNEELHTVKFLNKADLKFWHDFNLLGGCGATYFLPWYDACRTNSRVMDATILPRGASPEAIAAAGGKAKVYFEYNFPWLVEQAVLVDEERERLLAQGFSDSKVETEVRKFCISHGHCLWNGVPYCVQALEGVPDPLHLDCNEMKYLVELGNTQCDVLGLQDQEFVVEDAEHFVGRIQTEYWSAMVKVGLQQEQQRLANRKLRDKSKKKNAPKEFRVTGTKTTLTLRNFYELTDALSGRDDMETSFERLSRGELHLSFLFLRILSTLYSRFTITDKQLDKLGVVGRHYFALKVLSDGKVGANEHTMCYGMHHRLRKYFKMCSTEPGKSLGGGVLGSCQGLEGKHWFTRASMACNTSMRSGCWSEELYNSAIRMVYGEKEVPVPVSYGKYTYKPRIKEVKVVANHDQCTVCKKQVSDLI